MAKAAAKRSAQVSNAPRKKRRTGGNQKVVISIPEGNVDEDEALSDQDTNFLDQFGPTASFLSHLDPNAISRSKSETLRLKQASKTPKTKKPVVIPNDLPSMASSSEDEADSDSDSQGSDSPFPDLSSSSEASNDDEEMPYERAPHQILASSTTDSKPLASIRGLPIKLADGRIQATGKEIMLSGSESEDIEEEDSIEEIESSPPREGVETAARFGRPALLDVLAIPSRKNRIIAAKNQIAGICQDIVSDPENGLGLLRRLHSFSLDIVKTPTNLEGAKNDIAVRRLAILSQLAVFKDVIPGYRVRELTEKEKQDQVSQMVARTREYEQGLVSSYQAYLAAMEKEIKGRTELALTCLTSMCSLLKDATHFNFRKNLMNCIVSQLGKKGWDESSQMCLDAIIHVFRNDLLGQASLEVVQLLNRMIKEKHYRVNPTVLSALQHLKLRKELDIRASSSKVDKEPPPKRQKSQGKTPHLSKKAKKVLKEHKEIEKEFKEAEAEVDKEERGNRQTETLKLLFVLYFQILKTPKPTPLLPAALRGITKFAHLVNVDFFKDLLQTLKTLMNQLEEEEAMPRREKVQYQLMCIVTAFKLLSGQGESLMVDLNDFITFLYGLLFTIETLDESDSDTTLDLLFRALYLVFSPRTHGISAPSWRSAAFCKRLLTACLQWPTEGVLRALEFIATLLAKDRKLEGLLSTEEGSHDGLYRPDVDDPQLSNPFATCLWELQTLQTVHYSPSVRKEAAQLAQFEG